MEITRNQVDDLNIRLSITLEKEDYFDKYESSLKQYRKQVNMPGFRPGKVPLGLVKKQYGKAILAEELNRVLNDKLYEHIVTEKLNVLGNPIPVENDDIQGDWNEPDKFTFEYEMGLAPEIDMEKAMKKLPVRHTVKIDKKMMDTHVTDLSRRHGQVADAETSEENDLLLGTMIQLDENGEILEGGIMNDGTITLDSVEDKKTKKALTGVKKDEEIVVDPYKVSLNNDDLARMLNVSPEQVNDLGNFKFRINEIKRLTPHEVNQELYDKVFGKDEIKDEEEFRTKLEEQLASMFERDSINLYKRQMSEHIIDNLDVQLPDAFLKRWIQLSNEKPVTAEQVEVEYPSYSRFLLWQLVEGKVITDKEIIVTPEEIKEQAKAMIGSQYAQYGMPLDEEMLENFANNVLGDQNERQRINDVIKENKVLDALIEQAKIKEKAVSYEDFLELAKEHSN